MVALVSAPPGERIPEIDPSHRRLAQAVLIQAVVDYCHNDAEPADRESARAFLLAAECCVERGNWLMIAGIQTGITAEELIARLSFSPSLAQVASRTLGSM